MEVISDPPDPRLVVDEEPFLVVSARGYQPAVRVQTVKTRKFFYLFVAAQSLCKPLEVMCMANSGTFVGVEFWIRKSGPEKEAKYVVEE